MSGKAGEQRRELRRGGLVLLLRDLVLRDGEDVRLLGLDQLGWDTRTFEVPTLPGMLPRMFGNFIDSGMRSGIPEEDWAAVVTVYKEAHKLAEFTGNEGTRNGRILLLDGAGKVVFYHDRGYSVGSLKKLVAARAAL